MAIKKYVNSEEYNYPQVMMKNCQYFTKLL